MIAVQDRQKSKKSQVHVQAFLNLIFTVFSTKLAECRIYNWAATWQNQQNSCVPSEDSD